jgi:hypothetical protein
MEVWLRRRRRRFGFSFGFSDFRFEAAAATLFFLTLHAREGADGQAVVCPLLRGRSPTRGVAPKQHRDPLTSLIHVNTRAREVYHNC